MPYGLRIAPLFEGMGTHHHEITTDSPLAQRYFDQGLVLAYGFNHKEAARSFRQAQYLDAECALEQIRRRHVPSWPATGVKRRPCLRRVTGSINGRVGDAL